MDHPCPEHTDTDAHTDTQTHTDTHTHTHIHTQTHTKRRRELEIVDKQTDDIDEDTFQKEKPVS